LYTSTTKVTTINTLPYYKYTTLRVRAGFVQADEVLKASHLIYAKQTRVLHAPSKYFNTCSQFKKKLQ